MKMYLLKNHHVKSYIIGASVPEIFKQEGTPHMCHCAILIPISTSEFYIVDGALYFVMPMYCSLKDQKERHIYNCNAHRHEKTRINYTLEVCSNLKLDTDYEQTIPSNSLCVKAWFADLLNQEWNYYLTEIKNPDNNIGHAFLKHKPEPFIMYTVYENGIVKMKYKVEIKDDELYIKEYPSGELIYRGNTYDNNKNYLKVRRMLNRFVSDYMI